MNRRSTTKDELFLLKLYEMASKLGSPEEEVDRFAVGRAIGQNDKGISAIVNLLAQANFVKKGEGEAIYLTPHGLKLVASLKESLFPDMRGKEIF
jgi:hypothetical protein